MSEHNPFVNLSEGDPNPPVKTIYFRTVTKPIRVGGILMHTCSLHIWKGEEWKTIVSIWDDGTITHFPANCIESL